MAKLENIGKVVGGNMLPRFANVLLKLMRLRILRKDTRKGGITYRDIKTCGILLLLFDLQSLSESYGFNWLDP